MEKEKIELLLKKYKEIFEIEINQLGFQPTELRHLLGRIGEFICILEKNGTFPRKSNQEGYDVLSSDNRKISVKTTAQKSGFVTFNKNTLELADDVMVIQFSKESGFKTLYFGPVESIKIYCRSWENNYELDITKIKKSLSS